MLHVRNVSILANYISSVRFARQGGYRIKLT